mgnify:CR=1 FL=1|jgi:hypothetical protein
MGLETGTYISDFVITNPPDSDPATQLDDHIRLVKSFVTATFPGSLGDTYSGPVTATSSEIDSWDARLTSLEAQPTTLASPKSGMVTMSANQTYSVTGLGFQPNHIVAYCVDYWSNITSSWHTLGVTSWSASDDDKLLSVDALGVADTLSTTTTLVDMFIATAFATALGGLTTTEVVIGNVGSDGFDLSFAKFGSGARVMYLAFQ